MCSLWLGCCRKDKLKVVYLCNCGVGFDLREEKWSIKGNGALLVLFITYFSAIHLSDLCTQVPRSELAMFNVLW